MDQDNRNFSPITSNLRDDLWICIDFLFYLFIYFWEQGLSTLHLLFLFPGA